LNGSCLPWSADFCCSSRPRSPGQRPSLKALLVSGYSSDAVATRGFANVSALLLGKPFSLAALSHKVREALDGRTTTFT
jgi:hypothetical protein